MSEIIPADPEALERHTQELVHMFSPVMPGDSTSIADWDRRHADLKAKIAVDKWGALITWDCDSTRLRPIELEDIIEVVAGGMYLATVDGGAFDLSTSDGKFSARCAVAHDYCFSGRSAADYLEAYGRDRG